MYPTHILLKFISQEKFLNDFLSGSLYMNSLYYFWNEFVLESVKKGKRIPLAELAKNEVYGQADLFEGTIETSEIDETNEIAEHIKMDVCCRAVGYGYCNILSFYKLVLKTVPFGFSYQLNNNMKFLGNYVAIIKDKDEFLRRINSKAEQEGFKFITGNVTYKQPMRNGVPRDSKNAIICKSAETVDIKQITSGRDAFVKMNKYAYQNEWRLALYRGKKETSAYRLEIGDIRDIVEYCRIEDLEKNIDRFLQRNEIKSAEDYWYGNIKRREMRNLFYNLGDCKGELLLEIG